MKNKVTMSMRDCIIKNEKFEVVFTDNGSPPPNLALYLPTFGSTRLSYSLVTNNVEVQLSNSYLVILHESVQLARVRSGNLQMVCDYMNEYYSYSQEKIRDLKEKVRHQTKTALQLEIETLQVERNSIRAKSAKYKQVFDKLEEIKVLLDGLEE